MINIDKVRQWCLDHLEDEGNHCGIVATTREQCSFLVDILQPLAPKSDHLWSIVKRCVFIILIPKNHKNGEIDFRFEDVPSEIVYSDISVVDFLNQVSK